ncbi:unnamed protein product [Dracunculus medinensis]|uniref:DUF1794 domain-containing protein n=1 Tax=Dracunculus medinensis TaxID=318479 RepID=A0A0N4UJQ6_DRAME|nr:unnamed protein product [Dracunculus medinensis]
MPIAFLIGRWRSEFSGKAFFPTIPKFTYGEELNFSAHGYFSANGFLRYISYAWSNSDGSEMHSEYGFITVENGTRNLVMNTVMSNGFITIEKGIENSQSIEFTLKRIGRLNFSHDLPVTSMVRIWTLLDENRLENQLWMSTITHRLTKHTSIIYDRICP